MLKGKTVLIGVTGSIAAYKAASLCSALVKLNADVHVLMTENALNFINPITFETLTSNKCLVDTFDRSFQYSVEHVALSKKADIFMVAPASANIIAKLANGISDDMLTTTALACTCKKIVAPAMNTAMYENQVTCDNIEKLKSYGWTIADPAEGRLACGDVGKGKMLEPEELLQYIVDSLTCEASDAHEKDMIGVNVLVTAGATQEAIDPVRYITNNSSGKMGYAIANAAKDRGANVFLVSGKTMLNAPVGVDVTDVTSAEDMFEAVKRLNSENDIDIIIKAAAVADYTPVITHDNKLKKKNGDIVIELKRTTDILKYLGKNKKENQLICGFSMETENVIENSTKKLIKKNADLIAANSLRQDGAGFGVDTNILTLITNDGAEELPIMSKDDCAHVLLDKLMNMLKDKKLG